MATASVERERKRVRGRARLEHSRAANDGGPIQPKPRAKTVRQVSGLEFLLGQKRLSMAQFRAGVRYGTAWRAAQVADGCCIKSALDIIDGGGSGTGKLAPGRMDYDAAEWAFASLQELETVHALFDWETEIVAVLAVICGKQMTPMEATGGHRRSADEVEAALRPVLQAMIGHYRNLDSSSQHSSTACA